MHGNQDTASANSLARPRRHPLFSPMSFRGAPVFNPHFYSLLASEAVADIYKRANFRERIPMTTVILGRNDDVLEPIQLEILEDIILTMSREIYARRHSTHPTFDPSPREQARMAQWQMIKEIHSQCIHCRSVYDALQIAHALEAVLSNDVQALSHHLCCYYLLQAKMEEQSGGFSFAKTPKTIRYAETAFCGGRHDDSRIIVQVAEHAPVAVGCAYDITNLRVLTEQPCFNKARQIAKDLSPDQIVQLRTAPKPLTIGWVLNLLDHLNSHADNDTFADIRDGFFRFVQAQNEVERYSAYRRIKELNAHELVLSEDLTDAILALDDCELLIAIIEHACREFVDKPHSLPTAGAEKVLVKNLKQLGKHYVELVKERMTDAPESTHQRLSDYTRKITERQTNVLNNAFADLLQDVPASDQIEALSQLVRTRNYATALEMDAERILKTYLESDVTEKQILAQTTLATLLSPHSYQEVNSEDFLEIISALSSWKTLASTDDIANLISDEWLNGLPLACIPERHHQRFLQTVRAHLATGNYPPPEGSFYENYPHDALRYCREASMTSLTPMLLEVIHAVDDSAALTTLQEHILGLMDNSNFTTVMRCTSLIIKKTHGYAHQAGWEAILDLLLSDETDVELSAHCNVISMIWPDLVASLVTDDMTPEAKSEEDTNERQDVFQLPLAARNHPKLNQLVEMLSASCIAIGYPFASTLIQQLTPEQVTTLQRHEDDIRNEFRDWFDCQEKLAAQASPSLGCST